MTNSLHKDANGKFCAAKTWFSLCSGVVIGKFALSGIAIGSFAFGSFDAGGASMLIGAFGAVYGGRSYTKARRDT